MIYHPLIITEWGLPCDETDPMPLLTGWDCLPFGNCVSPSGMILALPSQPSPLTSTGQQDYDLLVIGGGSGGLACAKEGMCPVPMSNWHLQAFKAPWSGQCCSPRLGGDAPCETMSRMHCLCSWPAALQGHITLPGSPQQSCHCALFPAASSHLCST